MRSRKTAYTPATNVVLRWLTDAGSDVSPEVRDLMLGELFTSQAAVLISVVNGLLVNVVGLLLHGGGVFAAFLLLDLLVAIARTIIVRRSTSAAQRGLRTPTDVYLLFAILWCALQGSMAFCALRSGNHPLQVIAACSIVALIGPIAARYYPAPRLCMLLICLCDLPFAAGAAASGQPWLVVLILQTPLLLYGSSTVFARFRRMSAELIQAQLDSHGHARHDPLTALLNRFGLAEALARPAGEVQRRCAVFYLDLDGFKRVNDSFGHMTGDKLLQAVAARLRAGIRAGDVVARLGGDEFVVVADGMLPESCDGFAESLIRHIADEAYVVDECGKLRIGTSVGYACSPEDGTDIVELQRKADEALYKVKAGGKGAARRWQAVPVSLPQHRLLA